MPAKIMLTADRDNTEAAFQAAVDKFTEAARKVVDNADFRANVVDYALQLQPFQEGWSGSPGAYIVSNVENETDQHMELHMTIGSEIAQPFLERELASLDIVPKDKNEKDVFCEILIDFASQMVVDFSAAVSEFEGRNYALRKFAESADRNLQGAYEELKKEGF